ncbi:MAG: FtsW/RodA/SpoVE family cell cycle protein [Aphanocapsa feldmannii 288cV]|nr:MAG: FtsW/RodA/SpoVE family cell cycle protein [Aphanocapsa feldmannii 288cV]
MAAPRPSAAALTPSLTEVGQPREAGEQGGDWPAESRLLVLLTGLWSAMGLLVLSSASWWTAGQELGDPWYYIKRQLIWLALGWLVLLLAVRLPLRLWFRLAPMIVLLGLGLLVVTLLAGTTVNGAQRWIAMGPVRLQPSELIKPFLVLQAASLFSSWNRRSNDQRLGWLLVFGVLVWLVLKQPNLSTASLMGMLLWLIALGSGLAWYWLLLAAALGSAVFSFSLWLNPYQLVRVLSFLDPFATAEGNGYQLVQSLLAIGSGGWTGSGFTLSMQKLQYLPFQTTDFVFAVYAEEFGFIGGVLLLLFLLLYAFLGLRVSLATRSHKAALLAIGATTLLIGQSILNIGVATGTIPTTGLPLPLVSYGGNSLVACLFSAGLLIRVDLEREVSASGRLPPLRKRRHRCAAGARTR